MATRTYPFLQVFLVLLLLASHLPSDPYLLLLSSSISCFSSAIPDNSPFSILLFIFQIQIQIQLKLKVRLKVRLKLRLKLNSNPS